MIYLIPSARIAFILTSLLMLAAPSQAAGRAERARAELEKRFAAADANGDGRLTRDEAQSKMPHVYQNFDAIDEAGSGTVTLADIRRYALAQRGSRRAGR